MSEPRLSPKEIRQLVHYNAPHNCPHCDGFLALRVGGELTPEMLEWFDIWEPQLQLRRGESGLSCPLCEKGIELVFAGPPPPLPVFGLSGTEYTEALLRSQWAECDMSKLLNQEAAARARSVIAAGARAGF